MNAAARWYEGQQDNLGKHFLAEVQAAGTKIRINPLIYRVIDGDVRSCPVKRYPYSVLFRIQGPLIVVVAVMHHRRNPGFWKGRELDTP